MQSIHGGDIYRNRITLDYSVNCNPFGIPKGVKKALYHAVDHCHQYPDMEAYGLRGAVSRMLAIPPEYLLFGNGASELFMAIIHGVQPRKAMILTPSFYGYQHALMAVDCDMVIFPLKQEHGFLPKEDLLDVLTEDMDLLFLANPNNPTGQIMDKAFLKKLLEHCQENKILVVLDECFIEFCSSRDSMLPEIDEYSNLILVRAFTKIYAIPGVRLGYLICSCEDLRNKIEKQLPEWNLSVLGQEAGVACTKQSSYLKKTVSLIREERRFLAEGIKKLGLQVFPGEANFILFYSRIPLYDSLLKRGILIRDCSNYKGLSPGYYRIAVRQRKDNKQLLKAIGECIEES